MARREAMLDDDLLRMIGADITEASDFDETELQPVRVAALDYFEGRMPDTPALEGRSSVVSRDVSEVVGWIMPSLDRVFFANDVAATFEPVKPGDEGDAEQATDYLNALFMGDCDGPEALRAAFQDAILTRVGFVKVYWDETPEVETLEYTGLDDVQFARLVGDPEIEVLEHTEYADESTEATEAPAKPPAPPPAAMMMQGPPAPPQAGPPPAPAPMMPGMMHDVVVRRTCVRGGVRLEAVPPEEVIVESRARRFEEANFVAHRKRTTRRDLIAEGYDPELVERIHSVNFIELEETEQARFGQTGQFGQAHPEREEVEVYECFVRVDYDGDGVAERRRVVVGGRSNTAVVLANDEWNDQTLICFVADPMPHRWYGRSVFDDLREIQRVKTVLMRQVLDNVYASNLPQRIGNLELINNPDALFKPHFGGFIDAKDPNAIREAPIPFVADKSFPIIEYMDHLTERRTGISKQSMGLDPDAMQNQTALAAQLRQSAGHARLEMYARNLSRGVADVFRSMLKLTIRRQDKAKVTRLRGRFVSVDPRLWNSSMDVTVNVGLGTGSRERDLAMLGIIAQKQEAILMQTGMGNPLVGMDQYRNTLAKMVEAAGMRSPDQYFKDVPPNWQPPPPQPPPQVAIEQAKLQAEQMRTQAEIQLKQQKQQIDAQVDAEKLRREREAMEAKVALEVKSLQDKAEIERGKLMLELQIARERAVMDMQVKRAQLEADLAMSQANALRSVTPEEARNPAVQEALTSIDGRIAQVSEGAGGEANMPAVVERRPSVADQLGTLADQVSRAVSMMAEATARMAQVTSAPKRVVRDQNGRVVGVETIQ